jgi:hypothetical protein
MHLAVLPICGGDIDEDGEVSWEGSESESEYMSDESSGRNDESTRGQQRTVF